MYEKVLAQIKNLVGRNISTAFLVYGNVYDTDVNGDDLFSLWSGKGVYKYDLRGLTGDMASLQLFLGQQVGTTAIEMAKAVDKIAENGPTTLVIDYGALLFSPNMGVDERAVMTYLLSWARSRKLTVVIVAESEQDVPRELRSPVYGWQTIRIDMPSEEERNELLGESFANLLPSTYGLRMKDIVNLVAAGFTHPAAFAKKAAQIVNASYGGALRIVDPVRTFGDIAGMEKVKKEFASIIKSPASLWPSGALFMGGAGLGKTIFAEALAGEMNCPLIIVSVGTLRDMYQGGGEKNMSRTLAALDGFGRCVVLFDEMDMQVAGGNGTTQDQGMLQLLQSWLDGENNGHRGRVFPIGTTNYPERIPPALIRPGRLGDIKVLFMWPTHQERCDFWMKKNMTEELATHLADQTERWTFAELEALNRNCSRYGMQRALEMSAPSTDDLIKMSMAGARALNDLSLLEPEHIQIVRQWKGI